VPDHGCHRAIAERGDEPQRIPHQIEKAEGAEVAIVIAVPADGAAIAPLVGDNHMKPSLYQREHDLPPAVGEFREPMQQQKAPPVRAFPASLQHVHGKAVDALHEAAAYAGGQGRRAQGFEPSHRSSLLRSTLPFVG
jgi:hypothetical protein